MKHSSAFLMLVESVRPNVREITVEELAGSSHLLIDVREESEFAAGHAKDARHMGRGVIERDIEKTVADKNVKLVLYCGGGFRSALAADNLQKMGYTNVWSLAGGWRALTEKGYPRA
jgi:rhodanese-related sulfurtransferase